MLLPALNRSREYAKSIGCMSNFKQLIQASSSYSVDFNGFLPVSQGPNNSGTSLSGHWTLEVAPYLGIVNRTGLPFVDHLDARLVRGVFRCPVLTDAAIAGFTNCTAASIYCGIGYGWNYRLGKAAGDATYPRRNVLDVKKPSMKLLIGDSVDSGQASSVDYRQIFPTSSYQPFPKIGSRHTQGMNAALVDGHVEHFASRTLALAPPGTTDTAWRYCYDTE
jgi:prepilin-type processing-associated H-X9-DG protein